MELIGRLIAFLEAYPVAALVIGIAILLLFLYKHPTIFFILAVIGVVMYLVFTLSSVGISRKEKMIKSPPIPEKTRFAPSPSLTDPINCHRL